MSEKSPSPDAYQNLSPRDTESFPRSCENCGKTFADIDELISRTEPERNPSGLVELAMPNRPVRLALFRRCTCGSPIATILHDRRDASDDTVLTRAEFGRLLDMLEEAGLDRDTAREELLKVQNGEESEILKEKGIVLTGEG